MTTAILQGWLLGLSTGAYCLGLCAPALLPYLMSCEDHSLRRSGRVVAEFLAGRLVAYLLLGLLALFLGTELQTWPGTRPVAGLSMILLALLLLAHGLTRNFPEWRACGVFRGSASLRRIPLLAGLALGLSPCPPLLLGLTTLLTGAKWLTGLAFLLAFFLGTTLWLVPVMGVGSLARNRWLRGVAEVAVLFSGLWFLVQGICLLRG